MDSGLVHSPPQVVLGRFEPEHTTFAQMLMGVDDLQGFGHGFSPP
jgi:hypothetical protein